jgi:PAS domain-containing protein
VLLRDDPTYTIVAVKRAYARATLTNSDEIVGRSLFEVFPDNPDDPHATGVRNLHASLRRVLATKVTDTMAVQKYDIRRPDSKAGEFEERYWSPVNWPLLDPDGGVQFIIHRVEDVTEFLRRKRVEADQGRLTEEIRLEFIGISELISGVPIYANKSAAALVGADNFAEFRQISLADHFIPEERAFVREVALPAAHEQGRWHGELHIRHLRTEEIIPLLLVRQKKSWVDSGSGSLPSE